MVIALGILANLFFVFGGFFRSPKHTMCFVVLGNLSYLGYYYLIDLHAPIISVGIGTLACLIAIVVKNKIFVKFSSCISALVISMIVLSNMQSFMDLTIVMAAWAIASAQISKDSYIRYKFYVMCSQTLWVFYCVAHSDYAMLTTCAFIICTNLYSLANNMIKDGIIDLEQIKIVYVRISQSYNTTLKPE
jgi:hypothetical protein